MTPFEYVIVLISIILGLGITTILTGIAEWIKHFSRKSLFTPYIIWIILVFVMHIQDWWASYSLQSITTWQLSLFLIIVLYPINLYVLAHLIFPRQMEHFDAKVYYFDNYQKFFLSALILDIISILQNITISGYDFSTQIPQLVLFTLVISVLIFKPTSEKIHLSIAIFLVIMLVVSLMFTQDIHAISSL